MDKSIRVVIAEDYEMILRGLESLLTKKGFVVAGTAKDGRHLLPLVAETLPDVVLTDIQMPVMNGIEATRELQKSHPQTGIIGLTMYDEDQFVVDMLKAGAKGFLFKDESMDELYEAIEAVYEGKYYYCNNTSRRLMKLIVEDEADPFRAAEKPQFGEAEQEIIRLVCEGLISKEIADKTGFTFHTVRKYRQQIMDKLNVKSVAGIVLYAVKEGIYSLPTKQEKRKW